MVDSKVGKNFSKSMGRAKEKILQNLGKVDRTADEIFDEHVSNFTKQQLAATRLQKELNNYIRCIRACAAANKSLLEAVTDVYEPEWGDKELLNANSQSVEMLWNDFAHRLAEQVLIPLNTYQGQFPEMRKKIEKRGRKLVDFDGERHALQALQSNPRRAEAKLSRQRENLEAAKRTYEVLNSELHEELPGLFGSRIVFLVSAMSTLFASENIFHSESAKIYQEYEGAVERLAKESAKGTLNFKSSNNAMINNRDSMKDDNKGERSTPTTPTLNAAKQVVSVNDNEQAATPPQRPPHPNSTPIKENEINNKSLPSSSDINNAPSTNLSLSTPETNDQADKSNPDTIIKTTNNDFDSGSCISSPTQSGDISVVTPNNDKSNGVCDKETVVNGDGVLKINNASMEADITATTTAATTVETDTVAEKHNEQNGHVVDEIDISTNDKPNIVEPNTSVVAQTAVNGDQPKMNGNHTSAKSNGKSDEVDGETVAVEEKNQQEPKISSSSISANVKSPSPPPATATSPTSTTNQPSSIANATSNSNSPPATEAAKEEPGVLYRVRATYRYQKEDEDELSFEAGEIVRVIEYEDPEEQEEGWLMGVKDNGEKGMFPANFTRPL